MYVHVCICMCVCVCAVSSAILLKSFCGVFSIRAHFLRLLILGNSPCGILYDTGLHECIPPILGVATHVCDMCYSMASMHPRVYLDCAVITYDVMLM